MEEGFRLQKLVGYVNRKLETMLESPNAYSKGSVDIVTAELCSFLKELSKDKPEVFEDLVYNARDKDSRKLADWWEEHLSNDAIREANEQANKEKERLRLSAINKLTPEEIKALGI